MTKTLLVLLGLVAPSCASMVDHRDRYVPHLTGANVVCIVVDRRNQPIAEALCTLDHVVGRTNRDGWAVLLDLEPNDRACLTADAEGFASASRTFRLQAAAQHDVTLVLQRTENRR